MLAAHPVEHTPERFGHHGVRADDRQRVCAWLQECIGGQGRLGACRAEVVFTYGWASQRALPIHGEPNMHDRGDMNHRFLALTSLTQHTLLYFVQREGERWLALPRLPNRQDHTRSGIRSAEKLNQTFRISAVYC